MEKAENDPLHLKGVMFLACPPCPHSASFPPSHTHINKAKEDFKLCSSWKCAGEATALQPVCDSPFRNECHVYSAGTSLPAGEEAKS